MSMLTKQQKVLIDQMVHPVHQLSMRGMESSATCMHTVSANKCLLKLRMRHKMPLQAHKELM